MTGYTKLFSSILMSSIWDESDETRLVWVTMLALADQHGHIDGTVRSLARVSRVSEEACGQALAILLAADRYDRSGVKLGQRIEPDDGGWTLVNYGRYRRKMSYDERRERDKIRKRQYRQQLREGRPRNVRKRPQTSAGVRKISHTKAKAEAEAEKNKSAERARALVAPATAEFYIPKGAPGSSLHWHRLHGAHVAGFCDWMCLPQEDFHRYASRLGSDEAAMTWAQGVRASGVVPTGKPWEFWNAQFDAAQTAAQQAAPSYTAEERANFAAWQRQHGDEAKDVTIAQFMQYARARRGGAA